MTIKTNSIIQSSLNLLIWCLMGGVIGAFVIFPLTSDGNSVSCLGGAVYIITACFFSGLMSSPTAITNIRRDLYFGRVSPKPEEIEKAKTMKPYGNRWIAALKNVAIFWPVFSGAALVFCLLIFPSGLQQAQLAFLAAFIIGPCAAVVSFRTSRVELLKYVGNPPQKKKEFSGHLRREYIYPNAICNLFINAAIAIIIYKPGPLVPEGVVPLFFFTGDIVITAIIITILVSFDPWGHSMTDIRLNIADTPVGKSFYPATYKNKVLNFIVNYEIRTGIIFILCIGLGLFVAGILYLAGIYEIGFLPAVIMKSIIAAIYAGLAAGLGAYFGGVEMRDKLERGEK